MDKNLRMSTMTIVSSLSTNIDLLNLYDNFNINDIIKYIECCKKENNEKNIYYKGFAEKNNKKKRKEKTKKIFFNQLTIHLFIDKLINMKVFNNGKLQLTGVKSEEQGLKCINYLIDNIKKIDSINDNKIFDSKDINILNYDIVLINSDFDLGHDIERNDLFNKLSENGYFSTFEPCTYPGVKIKYYHNKNNEKDGICNCNRICNGKGNGDGDGDCKSITVAVFKSGKVLVTGGRNYNHINIGCNFIKNFINF